MIDGKPRASPAKAGHNFIGDHQDPVLIAQLPHALNVSIRRNENAVRPRHRLQNEPGNGVRAFQLDNFVDHRQRSFRRLPSAFDAMIRIKHVHHARQSRLGRPPPRIARKADRARRGPVIRTITRQNLVPSGKEARDLDGVLGGLRAPVGKEECVNVARSDLRQLRPQPRPRLRSHERIGISTAPMPAREWPG